MRQKTETAGVAIKGENIFSSLFIAHAFFFLFLLSLLGGSIYYIFESNFDLVLKANNNLSNAIAATVEVDGIKAQLETQDFTRINTPELAELKLQHTQKSRQQTLTLIDKNNLKKEDFSQLLDSFISHINLLKQYGSLTQTLAVSFEQGEYHLKRAFNLLPEAFKPQILGLIEQYKDSYGINGDNLLGKIENLRSFNTHNAQYQSEINATKESLESYNKNYETELRFDRDLIKSRDKLLSEIQLLRATLTQNQDLLQKHLKALEQEITKHFLILLIAVIAVFAFISMFFMIKRRAALLRLNAQIQDLCSGKSPSPIKDIKRRDEIGHIAKGIELLRKNIQTVQDMQQALRDSIEDTKNTSRVQNTMVSKIGSEIRTPLNSIIGYSEMVVESYSEDMDLHKIRGDILNIASAGRGLLDMVDSLLELTEESESFEVVTSTFNVRDEVQRNLGLLEPVILRNRNRFTVHCPDPTLSMDSDVQKVTKILINLISNAALNTRDGQITLNIVSDRIGDLAAVRFAVRDTGETYHSEATQELVQIFGQEDLKMTEISQNKIGAAIAKKYVNELYGKVEVDPNYREGTRIVIKLPSEFHSAKERNDQMFMPPLAEAI